IMQQTGVDYFFTTKMTWNAINRFPHSSFIWKGNDGSEVLAHVTQESGYVTHVTVDNVKAPMHANQQAAIHPEYLLPTGYGDGGGGVTDEMLERAKRLNQLPGMPKISWDHPEAFFERLSEVSDQLPVHQGECYLEYHRGTFTTHSNLKHAFRDLERALQLAEAASILTGKRWDLEHSWKRLVFSQFHDYIPGSSVWDVYLEGVPELESLAKEQRKKVDEVLSHGKSARSLDCWFNPHGVDVIRWLKVPGKKRPIYTKLPALSGTSIKEAALESPTAVSLNGKVASNGVTEFRINRNGWIDRLTWENVSVPLQRPLGQFVLYPDRAANFEPWDIDRHVLSLGNICKEKAEIKEIRKGDHSAGYEVVRSIGKQSQATVRFLLEAGSPLVHVEIDLDWQEEQTLLKFYLPTEYAATNARFGIPFGSVLRSQVPDSMAAEAMWEVPFSRYLAVFDEGEREGLFVISESKYGACVRNGEVGVSLVRSPRVTGMDGAGGHGRAWPPHLTRLKNLPSCSDLGKHQIRLALGRYDMELPRERQPASLADTLFTDPVFYKGNAMPSIIQSISGGDTLIPCWAKPSEKGGWSLRFQEVAGRRGSMQVSVVPGWKLHLSNLSETEKMPLNTKNQINFKPYQVVTLRLEKE
ncbi:MAG: glycoside hydrolase family 38 C-terminal domain-containing protein, partial [Verrucomicrobiota bacterium]